METKKLIKEKLHEEFNPHKRLSITKAIMQRCVKHLFDAYRELDTAIQYCDDPIIRAKLESTKKLLGNDIETSWSFENSAPSVIAILQDLSNDITP